MRKMIVGLLMVVSANMSAQKLVSGNLQAIANADTINFTCDFSKCIIDGKPAKAVIAKEKNWEKGVTQITNRFNEGFGAYHPFVTVAQNTNAKYTFVYLLEDIDDDQDCKGQMLLTETSTGKVLATIAQAKGSAGKFGSFFNLLGDAFESLGKRIGKLYK